MFRSTSKMQMMELEPVELSEVSSFIPAIWPRCRSSGAAIELAMVSGLAPGRLAKTTTAGRSTLGKEATGRKKYATAPAIISPIASRKVPVGRRMKGVEIDTRPHSAGRAATAAVARRRGVGRSRSIAR